MLEPEEEAKFRWAGIGDDIVMEQDEPKSKAHFEYKWKVVEKMTMKVICIILLEVLSVTETFIINLLNNVIEDGF